MVALIKIVAQVGVLFPVGCVREVGAVWSTIAAAKQPPSFHGLALSRPQPSDTSRALRTIIEINL